MLPNEGLGVEAFHERERGGQECDVVCRKFAFCCIAHEHNVCVRVLGHLLHASTGPQDAIQGRTVPGNGKCVNVRHGQISNMFKTISMLLLRTHAVASEIVQRYNYVLCYVKRDMVVQEVVRLLLVLLLSQTDPCSPAIQTPWITTYQTAYTLSCRCLQDHILKL